uniref:Endoplasmic reticulum membrane sensor NFE2L1 n=1 Tax=Acanthochromis polyacanthus TaxID=80966 RepID=A0A3Q1G2C8_9TELE
MALNVEDTSSTFNMNLLTADVVDRLEPENLPGFNVNFNSYGLGSSSFGSSLEENDMTEDRLVSPSSVFLVDEEDGENEDGLPGTLSDLLDDATILDEMRLLDLALEDGFTIGSLVSENEDEDAEEDLVASGMEVEVTIKQEELDEEEMGAVGGGYPSDVAKLFPSNYEDHKLLHGFSWLEQIGHDHTYNQPRSSDSPPYLGKMPTKHTKSRRARALKIPFSNELIVNLPVDEFNDLLTNYQLDEEQLTLIRDIRRRGKNKIAAQNCRKRKQHVLVGLENDVSGLRRHRSRLLREKQEALRHLQEMKRRLGMLYQEVFSRLRDEEGRPLDATEYLLHFGPSNTVTVASRQEMAEKSGKKHRDKKK